MAYQLLLLEIDWQTQVQIQYEAICISHRANTLGKDMIPIILPK